MAAEDIPANCSVWDLGRERIQASDKNAPEGNDCFILVNCLENFLFHMCLQQFVEIN